MLYSDKKGAVNKLMGTVVTLVLVLVFLVIFFAFIGAFKSEFANELSLSQKLCQAHNMVRSGEGVLSGFSIPFFDCTYLPIQEPFEADEALKEVDILLHDTWWMYLEGEKDMDSFGDEIYAVYSFELEEDMLLDDLFEYMLTHRRGREVTSYEDSDYNYLEANTPLQTICFDTSSEGILDHKFIAGQRYYILYFDDVELAEFKVSGEKSDAILISRDQEFDKDELENSIYTYLEATSAVGALTLNPIAVGVGWLAHNKLEDADRSCLGYAVQENI